jgi:citrate synthase
MLVWTGELPPPGDIWSSRRVDETVVLDGVSRIADRLRLVLAVDALRASRRRDPDTVVAEGRTLVATLVDALPRTSGAAVPRLELPDGTRLTDTIAARLWVRLSPRRATQPLLAVLNAALVLLADHEMAASALAARVAASTRAGVHDVVAAGMGALHGPLHGGESLRARQVLAEARRTSPSAAVERELELRGRLPGFGQVLYPDGDPRAVLLLQMLEAAGPHPTLELMHTVIDEAARRRLPRPNVDLALAALGLRTDMPEDAGTAIFTPARTVGWLAHAMEEYEEQPLRFRPRAVYVGPTPREVESART